MIKKILIAMLAISLVFAAGCGKKDETKDDAVNQQTQQTQQDTENEQQSDEQSSKNDISEIDVSNVTGEELDTLVETFNSETASEEEKEEARLKLEAIFKQAEENHQ